MISMIFRIIIILLFLVLNADYYLCIDETASTTNSSETIECVTKPVGNYWSDNDAPQLGRMTTVEILELKKYSPGPPRGVTYYPCCMAKKAEEVVLSNNTNYNVENENVYFPYMIQHYKRSCKPNEILDKRSKRDFKTKPRRRRSHKYKNHFKLNRERKSMTNITNPVNKTCNKPQPLNSLANIAASDKDSSEYSYSINPKSSNQVAKSNKDEELSLVTLNKILEVASRVKSRSNRQPKYYEDENDDEIELNEQSKYQDSKPWSYTGGNDGAPRVYM